MTAQLAPTPIFKGWDNNGFPLALGFLTTYAAGTTTPQATYIDSTQTTQNTNPIQLNFRGECPLWLNPLLAYKFLLTDVVGNTIPGYPVDNIQGAIGVASNITPSITNTFTLGTPTITFANAYFGPNGAAVFDPVTGNIGYYARTTAEIAAGVTPTNFVYPPGNVDRYGTNTTPGTTDMSAAFSAAAQVAGKQGCSVVWGATAPYRLNNPVNCTGIRGVTFEDRSSGSASSGIVSIIVAHTGHGFDLSTSTELTFNNMTATNLAGTVPKSLLFCARNAAGSGAGLHRFNNIRTASNCTFSFIYYGYGSEENLFYGCIWYNTQPGSAIVSHNASNPSVYTSSFVTIATGAQSNTTFRHIGCEYLQFGNSGSTNEICIVLENAANFTMRDGLWLNAHGLAYVITAGTSPSTDLTFDSIRAEAAGTQPTYGVDATYSGGGTCISWTFTDVAFDCSGECIHFTTGQAIQGLATRNTRSSSGKLLAPYSLSNSVIESVNGQTVVGIAGGTVTQNVFIGQRTNINLTASTASLNLYADNLAGGFGVDADLFTSVSTACTGALTTPISYQIRMSPNGKQVTLNIPAIVGTTTAAASFTLAVAIPAAYRPTQNLRSLVAIEDSGATVNQPGQVFVTASTGVIIVFKDIVGTGNNWTNGVTGGLASGTEITWNL